VTGAFDRLLAEVQGDAADPAEPAEERQLRFGGLA
jgi:hypothetical protein